MKKYGKPKKEGAKNKESPFGDSLCKLKSF
jgi:hypothetical protein